MVIFFEFLPQVDTRRISISQRTNTTPSSASKSLFSDFFSHCTTMLYLPLHSGGVVLCWSSNIRANK